MIHVRFAIFKRMILISKKYYSNYEEFECSPERLCYDSHLYSMGYYTCRDYDELIYCPGNGIDYIKAFDKQSKTDHVYSLRDCRVFSMEHRSY